MPNLGWMEIVLILVVILLLFGAKKLPDLARSMGRSARIFKSEVKEMQNENEQTPQGQITQAQESEQDFWERPENQPTAHPEQAPQQNQQVQQPQDPQNQ